MTIARLLKLQGSLQMMYKQAAIPHKGKQNSYVYHCMVDVLQAVDKVRTKITATLYCLLLSWSCHKHVLCMKVYAETISRAFLALEMLLPLPLRNQTHFSGTLISETKQLDLLVPLP
jgi:hypothetical protein